MNGGHCTSISFDTYDNAKEVATTYNSAWDFYVVIYDGSLGTNTSIAQIYKNGNLLGSVCFSVNISNTNISPLIPLTFGRYHGTTQNDFFFGSLDDVGIWNRVLTPSEIATLYQACSLSILAQPTNQTVSLTNSAQFVIQTSDSTTNYQWQTDLGFGFQNISNAGQFSGVTNDTLTVSNISTANNNQLFRCVVNSGSCIDTSIVASLTAVIGINETNLNSLFSLYPNPARNEITLNADESLIGLEFNITNSNNKSLIWGNIKKTKSIIDLRKLSSGIYFFTLGNEIKRTFKIVKSE